MDLEKHSDLLFESDWKVLIILDACRFDFFARAIDDSKLEGELKAVDSEAKTTRAWYAKHWSDHYPSITLISSNPSPWAHDLDEKPGNNFGESYKVEKNLVEVEPKEDFWQEPQAIFEAFGNLEVKSEKVILHTVSPHQPFRCEAGKRFLESLDVPENEACNSYIVEWAEKHSWEKIERYYLKDINYVLETIEENFFHLGGPVVLSSDHGELIGERGRYGHSIEIDHPSLRIVPWFEAKEVREGD